MEIVDNLKFKECNIDRDNNMSITCEGVVISKRCNTSSTSTWRLAI